MPKIMNQCSLINAKPNIAKTPPKKPHITSSDKQPWGLK